MTGASSSPGGMGAFTAHWSVSGSYASTTLVTASSDVLPQARIPPRTHTLPPTTALRAHRRPFGRVCLSAPDLSGLLRRLEDSAPLNLVDVSIAREKQIPAV